MDETVSVISLGPINIRVSVRRATARATLRRSAGPPGQPAASRGTRPAAGSPGMTSGVSGPARDDGDRPAREWERGRPVPRGRSGVVQSRRRSSDAGSSGAVGGETRVAARAAAHVANPDGSRILMGKCRARTSPELLVYYLTSTIEEDVFGASTAVCIYVAASCMDRHVFPHAPINMETFAN